MNSQERLINWAVNTVYYDYKRAEQRMIDSLRRTDLYVMYISDGYVYGAADQGIAAHRSYWLMSLQGIVDGWQLYYVEDVPEPIATRIMAQGIAGEQYYGDGYEAARAIAHYPARLIDEEEPMPHCDICGDSVAYCECFDYEEN